LPVSDHIVQVLHGIAIYNPDLLGKKELIDQFVARHALLTRLQDDLRAPRPQHKLLIGSRGMGKTTLLHRLRYAIEDDAELNGRWLPLVFPEEQYNVTRLSDFYINCIDALSDLLEDHHSISDAHRLDQISGALAEEDPEKLADAARDFLLQEVARLGKGLVLLIDNADLILDGLPEDQEWAFRELLSHESRLVLIGASVKPIEAEFRYGKAFHDFFQVHELRGFTEDETRQVLKRLAQLGGARRVEQWLEEDPAKLKTLNTLTGGNPRTVILLYHLLAQGAHGTVRSDLERLLDLYTPNYKARFEELPKQAQQVLDAVALHWDPATAADLARLVRSDVNAVSSQLSRLVKQGILEQVAYYPGPKTGFQIAERFFNIWYLMRASRRIRRKLQWLVEFLRLFYSQQDLVQQAKRHLQPLDGFAPQERLKHAEFCFCLAAAIDASAVREALETRAIHSLVEDQSLRREIAVYIDLDGTDTALKSKAEQMRALEEAHQAVLATTIEWSDRTPDEFWRLLGSVPSLTVEEKREIALKLGGMDSETVRELGTAFENEISRYRRRFLSDEVADVLFEAIRCGYMSSLADASAAQGVAELNGMPDILAIALSEALRRKPSRVSLDQLERALPATKSAYPWLTAVRFGPRFGWDSARIDSAIRRAKELATESPNAWDALGDVFHDLERYSEAIDAVRRTTRLDPHNPDHWLRLGALLTNHSEHFDEAEDAFGKALALVPDSARGWDGLGDSLRSRPGRQADSEVAYRRAISIDKAWGDPWVGLGILLAAQYRQPEADEALAKGIELTPEKPEALTRLAFVLRKHAGRPVEAEAVCQKAILLQPDRAETWRALGATLRELPGRQLDAEDAYRKAIALRPQSTATRVSLGNLVASQPARFAEAEEIYREAFRLNPQSSSALAQLGLLLSERSGRVSEAEDALREAISLRPSWAYPWGVLGDLLSDQPGRADEAEDAYRRAVALDERWPNPWGRLGDVLLRQPGREGEAEEAYRKTISLNPNPPNPWTNLGWVLSRQPGREAEAEAAFRHAIKTNPRWVYAWVGLGDLLSRQRGRESEVENAYREALSINQRSEGAWTGLAQILSLRADPGAIDAYRQVVRLNPTDATAWNNLAWALYACGEGHTDEAENSARRTVELGNDIDAIHTLATILVSRGKWSEAIQYAREFLSSGSGDSYEQIWPEIVSFFRECVKAGYTKEAVKLLTEFGLADRWRPLREALIAIAEGNRSYLRRVAPEIRQPAEKILIDLAPEGWDKAKRQGPKPSRRRSRTNRPAGD
jgi:tetratricopeptide (TPR) repeat protein